MGLRRAFIEVQERRNASSSNLAQAYRIAALSEFILEWERVEASLS